MQVSTCLKLSALKTPPLVAGQTRQRLLDAAARVFARDGIEGATTREIARAAGVNEVTLFRHFQSKEKLLAAVVQRTLDAQDAALVLPPASAPGRPPGAAPAPSDLRADLLQCARRYAQFLQSHMPLLRTLIGEIHRYNEHEARVIKGIFAPLKAELLATVRSAQQTGKLRPGIDPTVAADAFGGMIFMDALRRSGPTVPDYPAGEYQAACVDLFVRGIEA